jgi:hypothetical protein
VRLPISLAVLACARIALAEPSLTLPREEFEKILTVRLRPPQHLPQTSSRLDDTLSLLVTRTTHLVARVTGLRHGFAGFLRLENVTSNAHTASAPRIVVVGVQFGVSSIGWAP